MNYILQISNLHFLHNNNSNSIIDSFFQEVTKKLKDVPRGKKLLIINGDLHDYLDTNYKAAELFLKRLVCIMDIDLTQDVFLIPGNRDIGNDALLKSFLEKKDPNWKSHQETCLAQLEKGNTDCISERLKAFLPYSSFLQNLRMYDVSLGEDYPARTHLRNWRGKMNILHLNTCLIANGESRTNHITDVHSAADSKTWETYFDKGKPTIAIGHNDFYDLKIIQEARESGNNLDGVIRKIEDGFVVLVSLDERINGCIKKITNMQKDYPRTSKFIFEDINNRVALNEFENALSVYLNNSKGGERVPILTDFYLPARNIGGFLKDLKVLEEKLKLDLALYGSYATSIYSLRPKFNLEDKDFNKKAATFLRAGAYIIDRQDGKLAGGTPEGRLKAVVTNTEMKDAEQDLYTKIKEIFDQNGILSPDIKLGASSKFTLTHFRDSSLPKIML